MNAPDRFLLPDVQSVADGRNLAINRVGVKGLNFPLAVRRASGSTIGTVATVDMYVALPPGLKGTHMSRFVEVLHAAPQPFGQRELAGLLDTMLSRLEAESGMLELRFPYFVTKRAPVSGIESLLDYQVSCRAEKVAGSYRFTLDVIVPVTSLCPCSKEISEYGAHNQRSHITISAEADVALSVEELIAIAEEEASCELYGLLKRPDEKYVTERAYDNPKFVEDLVRDIVLRLDRDAQVRAFTVESENFESIHNHSAYAMIERTAQHAPA